MSSGDVLLFKQGPFGSKGSQTYNVSSGAVTSIKAGEFCLKALGAANPTVWTANSTAKPVVATDFVVGLSTSDSTDTASAAGIVDIIDLMPGMQFLMNPTVAATWNTQAKYDALVGSRVLLSTVGAVQTVLASDSATSGIVIMPLDISKFPGKVAVALRNGCSYLT